MGRAPCCSKVGLHRGPWSAIEDALLMEYIQAHGEGNWRSLPKKAGLLRCGKSCRLRWMNYLRPDIKRGNITPEEDDLIIRLHALLGNRWSLIAGRLPGRTDNEIKNYWNTHLSKRGGTGTEPKSKSTKKKQNKCNVEREKAKIYIPKPTRFTSLSKSSRNNSFDWTATGTSHEEGDDNIAPWTSKKVTDEEVGGFLMFGNDDHDLVNGSEHLEYSQSHVPSCAGNTTTTSLENLYEEYLHTLLNTEEDQQLHHHHHLDSFAMDSLLV